MPSQRFHSSSADPWTSPRAFHDATSRYRKHGPIQPMVEEMGYFRRLFARRWPG